MKKLISALLFIPFISCITIPKTIKTKGDIVQDYVKVNGKWTKTGNPYPLTQDTIRLFVIH